MTRLHHPMALGAAALLVLPGLTLGQGAYEPPRGFISPDVRIAGIDVGGLTVAQARARVVLGHIRPRQRRLQLSFRGRRLSIDPKVAGYRASVEPALVAALAVGRTKPLAPIDIPLRERVDRAALRAVLAQRSPGLTQSGRDASVSLRGRRPRVTPFRWGYEVNRDAAVERLAQGMIRRGTSVYPLPVTRVAPKVTGIGTTVVVERDRYVLSVYRGERRVQRFRIAVGQVRYPTPSGSFRIIQMQRNPTWFPPSSPWARGLGPVPPGPGNPLGTRWMGTSAPAIGIHGTPAPWSLGSRASHGCIRMAIRDAEAVYERVQIGTPVYIV